MARAALDRHREAAFPAYGAAINDFLARSTPTSASARSIPNISGGSAANYSLRIDGHAVALSEFGNTLSSGDRNTLALAFFFATLQRDPARAQKLVVIDDPMTSLDEHRTQHTLEEIDRLSREVASIVVLSHDKSFLASVWRDAVQSKRPRSRSPRWPRI